MRIDPQETRVMCDVMCDRAASRRARQPWMQLLSAVLGLAGSRAELLRHAEKPWASVTFSGTRHTIALAFAGPDGIAEGESFIAALPDHEFTLSRYLVADARISEVDHRTAPDSRLTVEIELLLLEAD